MQFYHETDIWLFGGVFDVLSRYPDRYEVRLSDTGAGFIGRLKLRAPYRGRTTRVNFENHYADFEVQEILREPYTGRSFPGYEDIDVTFDELETLVRNDSLTIASALVGLVGAETPDGVLSGHRSFCQSSMANFKNGPPSSHLLASVNAPRGN